MKDLLKSKKFMVSAIGVLLMVLNACLKVVPEENVWQIAIILGGYVVGQGIADHGAQGVATAVKRATGDPELMNDIINAMGGKPFIKALKRDING